MFFNRSAFILLLLFPVSVFCQNNKVSWQELAFTNELSARINADLILPKDTKVFRTDETELQAALLCIVGSPHFVRWRRRAGD